MGCGAEVPANACIDQKTVDLSFSTHDPCAHPLSDRNISASAGNVWKDKHIVKGCYATPDAFLINLHNPFAPVLLCVVKCKDEKSGRLSESTQILPLHLNCSADQTLFTPNTRTHLPPTPTAGAALFVMVSSHTKLHMLMRKQV